MNPLLPPYPPSIDWAVEEIANRSLLETRINQLRLAGTGVEYILGNASGYTLLYLRPAYNFESLVGIVSGILGASFVPIALTYDPATMSSNLTLSNGNMTAENGEGDQGSVWTTFSKSSGKWYCEWHYDVTDEDTQYPGIVGPGADNAEWVGAESLAYGLKPTGRLYNNGSSINDNVSEDFTEGDYMMMALDMDNGEIYFGVNGQWGKTGYLSDPAARTNPGATGLSGEKFVAWSTQDIEKTTLNLGPTFEYDIPVGFQAFRNY